MIIEFDRKEDEASCTKAGVARVAHGLANEKKLLRIMSAIAGAENMADVKAIYPRMHWLSGDRHWQLGIPLADAKRLVLEPLSYVTREWQKIEAAKVIGIMDYHK